MNKEKNWYIIVKSLIILGALLLLLLLGKICSAQTVSVKKFGAKQSLSDNCNSFKAAMKYARENPGTTITLPAGVFKFKDSVLIDTDVTIQGTGDKSILHFPENKSCIVVKYPFGQNGINVTLKDFYIRSEQSGTGPFYTNRHGIQTNCRIDIERVSIYGIGGDGIHISACAIPTNGDNNNYGNASLSTLRNVTAINCNNGIFAEGCDANTILIENPNTSENRRWGIYLNGQLGSIIVKPHTAFNGAGGLAGQNSVVAYNGKYYAAIPGHDGYFGDQNDSNVNKQPDISSYYWKQVPFMFGTGEWDASKRYYSGGAIAVNNPNSWSNIVNAYTEAFQPPIYLNGRSKVDGGTNGAGVRGGSYDMVIDGERKIMNSNLVLPNMNETVFDSTQKHLTIGKQTTDYSAPLVVYNNQSLSGNVNFAGFETTAPSGYLQLKNPYSTGYIGYSIDEFNFYPSGYGSLAFTVSKDGVIIHGIKNFQTNTEAKNAGLKPGTIYMTAGFLKAVE